MKDKYSKLINIIDNIEEYIDYYRCIKILSEEKCKKSLDKILNSQILSEKIKLEWTFNTFRYYVDIENFDKVYLIWSKHNHLLLNKIADCLDILIQSFKNLNLLEFKINLVLELYD